MPIGGLEVKFYTFFNLGVRWGWVVNATPRPLYPRQTLDTYCIGGWVGARAGLDGWRKSRPPPGFDPRTGMPVASRYTDWAIAAQQKYGLQVCSSVKSTALILGSPFNRTSIKGEFIVGWSYLLSTFDNNLGTASWNISPYQSFFGAIR
jgi:hypothetical protein